MNRTPLAAALLLLLVFSPARIFASDYPEIRVLSADDPLFVQHQAALEDFYRITKARDREPASYPPLTIFEYKKRPDEDIFSISARLGLPYDTLATLNDCASPAGFNARERILLASQSGIFVNDPPTSSLEDMMLSTRRGAGQAPMKLVILRAGRRYPVLFFPAQQFSPIERAYFLGILFEFPIVRGRVTSLFGPRKDPFTGKEEFHSGIDIGALEGTEVHAARDGTVEETGSNEVLGNFIVLGHPGGYQTIYGHLSAIRVTIGMKVSSGSVIGQVGHTGRATGPHLHFEVKRKGSVTDPYPLLARRKS